MSPTHSASPTVNSIHCTKHTIFRFRACITIHEIIYSYCAAEEVLDSKGLPFLGSGSARGEITNEGLLVVPPEALEIWARQQHQSTRRSAFVHQMSLRYMSLVGIVGTAVVATYIVPKILQHA